MRAQALEAFSYRADPAVPSFPDDRPILIFDGHCVLCSRFVQFILRTDKNRLGTALYRHFGLDPVNYESNILIEDGRAWLKSEGFIRVFERLGFPWSLMSSGRLLPRPVRDWLYEVVARNRLRWFGVRQTCYLPDPSQADRFLQ